jgi:hypothetical protein
MTTSEPFDLLSLDFDGVLHPTGLADWSGAAFTCPGAFQWWDSLEDQLVRIEASTGVRILVACHSTWRLLFENDAELLALAPESLRARFAACAPRHLASREKAAIELLSALRPRRFAAMDDEPEAFAAGTDWLIACNRHDRGASHPGALAKLSRLFVS